MNVAPLYPYLPPSRQTWETLTFFWQFFPLVRNSSLSISTEDTTDYNSDSLRHSNG